MDCVLNGMVYPLTDTEQEHAKEAAEDVTLRNEIEFYGQAGDHAACPSHSKGVPPVFHLELSHRVTHTLNEPFSQSAVK